MVWDDEIGVSPSLSPKVPNISVPYGSLVPADLEGVLGPGRHISCDPSSHTFLREIPQCWMTGQAAGVAAALAAAGSSGSGTSTRGPSSASCCARGRTSPRPWRRSCASPPPRRSVTWLRDRAVSTRRGSSPMADSLP